MGTPGVMLPKRTRSRHLNIGDTRLVDENGNVLTDRSKAAFVPVHGEVTGEVTLSNATNVGNANADTLRTVEAANSPVTTSLAVIDDWDESDRAKVNPIVGQAGVAGGAGASGATTIRVVLASDSPVASAVGVYDQADMGVTAFDASTLIATLATNATYLIIATEDCHWHTTDGAEAATTNHMFLPKKTYLVISTNATVVNLYAIKSSAAGNMHYARATS